MRATGALGLAAGGASPGPGCHSQPLRCPPHVPRGGAQGPACGRLTARSPQVRGGAQPRGAQAERAAVSAGPEALLRGAVGAGLRRPVRLRVRRRRRPAALVTTAARDCPRRCAGAAASVSKQRGWAAGAPAGDEVHCGGCRHRFFSTEAGPRGSRRRVPQSWTPQGQPPGDPANAGRPARCPASPLHPEAHRVPRGPREGTGFLSRGPLQGWGPART